MFPGAIVFRFGTYAVSLYNLIHFLAFGLSIFLVLILAKREKLPLKDTATFLFFGVFIAIAGSKAYGLLENAVRGRPFLNSAAESLLELPSGSSFYGALLACLVFSWWYLKHVRLPLWKIADIAAAGTVFGFAIARLGCFLSGCCYGRPSSLPWAVSLPELPDLVHPTQLYESALNFGIFFFMLRLLKRKRFDGHVLAADAILNSAARFVVEYFRGDPGRGYLFQGTSPLTSLSIPQTFALLGLAAGMAVYVVRLRHTTQIKAP